MVYCKNPTGFSMFMFPTVDSRVSQTTYGVQQTGTESDRTGLVDLRDVVCMKYESIIN